MFRRPRRSGAVSSRASHITGPRTPRFTAPRRTIGHAKSAIRALCPAAGSSRSVIRLDMWTAQSRRSARAVWVYRDAVYAAPDSAI